MPVTTIAGHEIHVDDEGFMTVYDEWDEDLGAALAAAIDVPLTDDHWKAIRFLRDDFKPRARPRPCAASRPWAAWTSRRCSRSSRRSRPRRWPTSPACPSPPAASDAGPGTPFRSSLVTIRK